MIIFDLLMMFVIAYIVGFLYYGLYRNITARFQRRFGPPIWQSFYDSIKFFTKKDATSHGWMFYLGPIIMMTGSIITLLFIPFFYDNQNFSGLSSYGNLFVVLYLMVLGALGNALAVGVSGNPFGVMGVTRGLSRLFAMELPFYIAVIGLMSINDDNEYNDVYAYMGADSAIGSNSASYTYGFFIGNNLPQTAYSTVLRFLLKTDLPVCSELTTVTGAASCIEDSAIMP